MTKFINTVGGRRGRLDTIPELNLFQRRGCRRGSEVFGKFLEDHDEEVCYFTITDDVVLK